MSYKQNLIKFIEHRMDNATKILADNDRFFVLLELLGQIKNNKVEDWVRHEKLKKRLEREKK